ncbi:hypothetical protein MMYC01_205720 [Madurella mycetomatis]|uniref:Uncharacterized protein n=1 Tax=Madurella mycetomatis TaxID=100816 RepID=A0A175W0Z4_9PEZI|nr:hypothetical protein MMYC01_205720 [Madurella mycetomatis]
MAGPRAPIGTLSQHAAAAAGLVRRVVPKVFRADKSKRVRKSDESDESDSDSDSDSDAVSNSGASESGDGTKQEDSKGFLEKLKAKKLGATPQSKTTGGKAIKAGASVSATKVKQESSAAISDTKLSTSGPSAGESEGESASGSDVDNGKSESASDSENEVKEAGSSSDSESSDEEMAPSPVKSSTETKTVKSSPASSSATDNEIESNSDESASDESASSQAKVSKKMAPTTKELAPQASSESESESESEGEGKPAHTTEMKKTTQSSRTARGSPNAKTSPEKPSISANGSARSKEFVSESDSESVGNSDEPPESDAEDAAKGKAVQKRNKTAMLGPSEIVSQGFSLRKAEEDVDAATVARVFKNAKAEGKQIWYFTTPKSVPIEVIQKHAIPLDKIRAGQSIFAHEGAEYTGHFEEPVSHAIKVLIPGKTGTNYETLSQPVDRVMHITRVTRFGQDSESQSGSASATSAAISTTPRPQPKGLKARYLPFGVTNGGTGRAGVGAGSDEDVEMAQAPPLLTSLATDAHANTPKKAAKKRKHGDVEKGTVGQEEVASAPKKKSKKTRVENSDAPAALSSSTAASRKTPIAPPPIPAGSSVNSAKTSTSSEPAQPSPATTKKSSKETAKKKDSALTKSKRADSKEPSKVTPIAPPAVPGAKSA